MKFLRSKKTVKITEVERKLFNSFNIVTAQPILHRKELSLDTLVEKHGDSLSLRILGEIKKTPYDDLQKSDLAELIKKTRNELGIEILSKGRGVWGRKLLKYYLAIFDVMTQGKEFSYSDLAQSLRISRARLENLRDGLLSFPSMKKYIRILREDAYYGNT